MAKTRRLKVAMENNVWLYPIHNTLFNPIMEEVKSLIRKGDIVGMDVTYLKRKDYGQKNFGIKQSKGKYVYIIDSDFIVEPEVIEEAVRKCDNENFDAIWVHNTSDSTISFWSNVRKLERDCYKNDELNVTARFFKKGVFETVGGFNESIVAAEDYDFHNRLLEKGFKIGRIQAQVVHIGEPKSLWKIAKKHYYYSKTIGEFIKANLQRGIKQLSPIRPAFIKHWKVFAKHPILTLRFIVYQSVEYFSAGLGFLMSKVRR